MYSLVQNVTVEVYSKGSNLSDPASSAAHVSLSSHLQLSNNRPENPVKIFPDETTAFLQPSLNQTVVSIETPERGSSSPAAPPPSSVIGLIDPTQRTSQLHLPKFFDIFVTCCFRLSFFCTITSVPELASKWVRIRVPFSI